MFGVRKLLLLSVLVISFTLGLSEESFFWKIFSRGKSIFSDLSKSDRRTEGDFESSPEHRETDEKYDLTAHDNYYGDYTGYTQVVHRDNMELYTLLGGLSFASLLATTLILLTRRNGTLLRSSSDNLFRRNEEGQKGNYEMVIKLPKFLYNAGKHLTRPWWSSNSHERKAKGFQPISLVHPELVNN